jgi:transglutaminase-like putative cysteine protease
MRLDFAFRLSTYLSLGFAVACLAYAEDKYVPGVGWFGVAVGVLLLVAFCLEGRWSLPLRASNFVGAGIALGTVFWVFYRLVEFRADVDSSIATPWPAILLPYLGPLLMVVMLAKLLRPKLAADYWVLQVVGLLQVALAAALANDPQDSDLVFGVLLFGYASLVIWWTVLAHLNREVGTTTAAQERRLKVPWRFLGFRQAVAWLAGAGAVGLVLFLMTPRVSSLQQPFVLSAPGGGPGTTGYSDSIDLNVTGQVQVNNELAFQVVASYERTRPGEKPSRPKTDLGSDQRWRGASLNYYDSKKGKWQRFPPKGGDTEKVLQSAAQRGAGQRLTLAGPGVPQPPAPASAAGPDFYLLFALRPKTTHGVFLADPVVPRLGTASYINAQTVSSDNSNEMPGFPWQQDGDGTPKPHVAPSGGTYYYLQRTYTASETGLTPASPNSLRADYIDLISTQQPLPRIRAWTSALLRRLASERRYNITEGDLEASEEGLFPRRWEKVARALKAYLVSSGEFGYTLDLRREDYSIDPVEDFLFNVKAGHCERYATALTLMLRSQGIPARVVLGYQGAEHQSEGLYHVRQSDAHSWVEVLIERPVRKSVYPQYYWLALDPTPPDQLSTSAAKTLIDWGTDGWRHAQTLWRDFVVGYNFEVQNNLGATLEGGLGTSKVGGLLPWRALRERPVLFWGTLGAAFFGILALSLGTRMARRRWRERTAPADISVPSVGFYARWLDLLARHLELAPQRTQTPREFADGAAPVLAGALSNPSLAALPVRVAQSFYRVRYGQQALSEDEMRALDHQFHEVESLLAARSGPDRNG